MEWLSSWAPGEKDVLSGGEGVHAPFRRPTGGAFVGVDAHGEQAPAVGPAHVATTSELCMNLAPMSVASRSAA